MTTTELEGGDEKEEEAADEDDDDIPPEFNDDDDEADMNIVFPSIQFSDKKEVKKQTQS